MMHSNGWHGGFVEWTEDDTAFLSVVFSWQVNQAYQRAVWYKQLGYQVRAGGPAVAWNPWDLEDVAEIGGYIDALPHHNSDATFTTRGCIRKCPFCAVPRIEGDLVELQDWIPRRVVCDNNLLAASNSHFNCVIDSLKPIKDVDFNQGLDARLLTPFHAHRLAELQLLCIRLAWDDTRIESQFMRAFETLVAAGIPPRMIRVYVLIGFLDTPEDALYRLMAVQKLGAWPNPMRYQPLDSIRRNAYVAPGWTNRELIRYMRYWQNLRVTSKVPFKEFR